MKQEPNYIFPFFWMRDQSEETLRLEIEKIYECGIRSVCLESRPHPDFGGPGWWADFDIVLDEAKKRGMKIWILDDAHFPTGQANGMLPRTHPELARKYAMMQHTDCVGPVPYATLDVELMMTKQFTWMDFGRPVNKPLMDKRELLSVTAAQVLEGDILTGETIDLTPLVKDKILFWDIPKGVWRICVTFTTYDFGARNEYIQYIDENSVRVLIDAIYELHYKQYGSEFGKTIAGFFSDEPGFYNVEGFDMDDKIGRKKMALPWCEELEGMMGKELGEEWKKNLPYLWMPAEKSCVSVSIRRTYMDIVSHLYEKNFCGQIGKWCEEHHVSYIGHVIEDNGEHTRLGSGAGHYFRSISGQHMAGIDTIGGQIIPGNPYASRHGIAYVGEGMFYHFGLTKMGASAAQIDPKKKGRLMCEAFGAYGWNFGIKSMKWVADFLMTQGVNHLVPHAFSMADYPDIDCPPHFYARGNNPQFPYFAELMKYINRMCGLLNGGQNVPVAGVLYHAENEWMNDCMPFEKPLRELMEHQIDAMVLPEDIFWNRDYFKTEMKEDTLAINGRTVRVLVIPETEFIDENLAAFIVEAGEAQFPVWFVNKLPSQIIGKSVTERQKKAVENCPVIALGELSSKMKEQGYYDVLLEEENPSVIYYHYRKESELYLLFNTSLSDNIRTTITFPKSEEVFGYDMTEEKAYHVKSIQGADETKIELTLNPYEIKIICFGKPMEGMNCNMTALYMEDAKLDEKLDISDCWMAARTRAVTYPDFPQAERMDVLQPVSLLAPDFAGVMRYEKKVMISPADKVVFVPEYIFEAAEVFVNGQSAGKRFSPQYRWDISRLCQPGENEIVVEVANTPARDTLVNPGPFGPDREIMEPSGMFGKIMLELYR